VIAGPNGAGKTTFSERLLAPVTHLELVNADVIAGERWPDGPAETAYEAAALAAEERSHRISARRSFATETVFSHPSKLELLREARAAGYRLTLHVVTVPVELAVARVANRVSLGGHFAPETKVRERYGRLFAILADAVVVAHEMLVYDNSRAVTPFREVAVFLDGHLGGNPAWPHWMPDPLRSAGQ
jgi:predicted ABC-type ATPase